MQVNLPFGSQTVRVQVSDSAEVLTPQGGSAVSDIRATNVTVIIAWGNHRLNSKEEIRQIIGKGLATRLQIVNHDCNDNQNLVAVGKTVTGLPVWVNMCPSTGAP